LAENGAGCVCTNTGVSALALLFDTVLKSGDTILVERDCYGGTYRLLNILLEKYEVKTCYADFTDLSEVEIALQQNEVKLILCESPTNPSLKIVDLKSVADLSKKYNTLFAVDNSMATFASQKPLDLGADIVMHSATKYLGGHSDVIAGALIVKDEALGEKLHFAQFATGGTLGPMDSYLVLRGIKTLHLRVQRHCENGAKVAEYLVNHPKVDKVFYPGLESHPNHDIAKKQMIGGFGGMVSFTFKSGAKADAIKMLEKVKVFTLAESLGGVESLANHPALMTHASIPEDKRKEIGITDDLVRLSVGVEDISDLLADLEQAFQ
jgi:cystathionine beta-lyase